jgi:putative NADH-flavin reductase
MHQTVIGDVLSPSTLDAAMSGVSTVVCVLGTPLTREPVTLLSDGTANLVAAMKGAGARRLLCVTGMGAGDSRGHGGFVYDRIIMPYLLGEIYKDKDRQESIVKSSALDWSIIRPARLTNGSRDLQYRELIDLTNQRMRTISRADVAHFVLRELKIARYPRQIVNLTN